MGSVRKVRVLMNPRSGVGQSVAVILRSVEDAWSSTGADVTYQVSQSVADGAAKVRRAIDEGVHTILVAGGDGMVNSIGGAMLESDVEMGVLPTGSGNGFARHFGVPLRLNAAAAALAKGKPVAIDVGKAAGHPFFVTCSMAADAAIARTFSQSPVRGILPYVFAAAYEMFEYRPNNFRVVIDGKEELSFRDVMLFTIANLTQYGGGARIAPMALPDDGKLELVVVCKDDMPAFVASLPRLFNGTIHEIPGVTTRRFQKLDVHRPKAGVIQVDGEVREAPATVQVRVKRRALITLVPG